MQAIIQTGGKQYKVEQGDELLVELLPVEVGSEVRFEDVRLLTGEKGIQVGTPRVDGAVVVGKVLTQTKGKKVRSVKFRRRKGSKTVKGHRQNYHLVRITAIEG